MSQTELINNQTNIIYQNCGLKIHDNITIDELKQTLQTLSFTEKNNAFYIGDILCHLAASKEKARNEKSNDERQKESIYKTFLEQNRHSRANLEKYHKVAKTFTISERQKFNKKLSFNHFYEALTLTKDKRAALGLLEHSASNDLSLSEQRAFYRTDNKEQVNEPEIIVSPVVALCAIAQELSRKITSSALSPEEGDLLLTSLLPVIQWTDNHIERKNK